MIRPGCLILLILCGDVGLLTDMYIKSCVTPGVIVDVS